MPNARSLLLAFRSLFAARPSDAEITGSFDGFSERGAVCGWAHDIESTARRVKIIVLLGDDIVAEGHNDQARADHLPGFRIDTCDRISPRDIVERRARVFAVNTAGRRFGLPRHGPLIAQLMRQCFPPE